MSSSLQASQAPTIDNTLGAVFLGALGASILYGITTLQVWLYYHRYLRDSVLHKVSVGILWTLDTLHQALTIHTAYIFTIRSPGDPKILWSTKLQVAINVIIVLIVQSLYAYRVWILSGIHHGYLGYIVASVVAAGFVVGVLLAYVVYTSSTFQSLQNVTWAINTSLATSTTIDFIISLAMCYYLRKSQGSEQRLNSKITTIMQYMLSSGLLTSAVSLSTLFTYTLMPDNLIFLGLQFLVTKFYVGSFLAMLNARQRPLPKSNSELDSEACRINLTNTSSQSLQFRVQTTVHTHTHTDADSHVLGSGLGHPISDDSESNLNRNSYRSEGFTVTSPSSTYVSCDERSYPKKQKHKSDLTLDTDSNTVWDDVSDVDVDLGVGVALESPASAIVHARNLHGTERYHTTSPPRDRRPEYNYTAEW